MMGLMLCLYDYNMILTVDELKKNSCVEIAKTRSGYFFFKMGIIHCMYILEKIRSLIWCTSWVKSFILGRT